MSYPPIPDQPYGQAPQSGPQPYGYGTPPGYGYQPPTMPPPEPPRRRSNAGLIVLLAVGLPLLVIGGCSALVVVLGAPASRDNVITEPQPAGPSFSLAPTNQPPAPKKETSTAKVGETIALEGFQQLQVAVMLNKLVDPATSAQDFIKPKPGHRFVAVQVTLTNTGTVVYSDSPSNGAFLIDAEGQQYRSTFAEVREGAGFQGTVTMSGGDSRKGAIVFEVPETAKLVKLQFALNSGMADQKGEWLLS